MSCISMFLKKEILNFFSPKKCDRTGFTKKNSSKVHKHNLICRKLELTGVKTPTVIQAIEFGI